MDHSWGRSIFKQSILKVDYLSSCKKSHHWSRRHRYRKPREERRWNRYQYPKTDLLWGSLTSSLPWMILNPPHPWEVSGSPVGTAVINSRWTRRHRITINSKNLVTITEKTEWRSTLSCHQTERLITTPPAIGNRTMATWMTSIAAKLQLNYEKPNWPSKSYKGNNYTTKATRWPKNGPRRSATDFW